MLVIPMTGKISWRNPPYITIVLILLNCFFYFVIQSGDGEKYRRAGAYYMQSGLAAMESARFMEYMKATHRTGELSIPAKKELDDPAVLAYLYPKMIHDSEFMAKLNNEEIIKVGDPEYTKWKELKKEYEQKLAEIIGYKYGYKPSDSDMKSAFTYMFLHGSASHLIGNMIFLWLVGCTLELAGKRPLYALIYLLTGLVSALVFGLVYKSSAVPLVGASGAISGIIGAYTVLFGMRKVKVFYSLGFYFSTAKVAAIFLLPLWICNEVYQLYFGGMSNVAYVGHIAGLVCGAALGFVQLKMLGGAKQEALSEDRADQTASLIEAGLQKLSEFDLQGARTLMNQVLDMDPENRAALTHLFNIDKLNPEREEFHSTAVRLLLRLHREQDAHEALYNTYQEYCRVAKPPRLPADLLSRLSLSFSQNALLEDASKIAALLLRQCPQYQSVPTVLLSLSRAYLKGGQPGKAEACLRLLCHHYPQCLESQIAEGLMKDMVGCRT
jgi:membrane associated rhomboid family serine protease